MANDVTITLKVRDGEVKKGEESIRRLKTAAKDVGPDSGQDRQIATAAKRVGVSYDEMAKRVANASTQVKAAQKPIAEVAKVTETLSPAATGAAGGFSRLAAAAGPAGIAVVAVAAAAIGLIAVLIAAGKKILEVTKAFADYAVEIGRIADETGLAVTTISALRNEADATGESFARIESAAANFRKAVGEAAAGSRSAGNVLKQFGIDGTKAIYDIDTAFKTAVRSVYEMPPGLQQAVAAQRLFGDEWYKMLPLLRQFNGDIDQAISRAKELGIVMSDEDVAAAREFTRAYSEVQKLLKSVTYTFGRELLPVVQKSLQDIGGWIRSNEGTIRSWASSVGTFVSDVISGFRRLISFVEQNPILTRIILGVATYGASEVALMNARQFSALGSNNGPQLPSIDANQVYGTPTTVMGMPDPAALNAARVEMERQRKEAEAASERNASAAIQAWQLYATQVKNEFQRVFTDLQKGFAETGNAEEFKQNIAAVFAWYTSEAQKTNETLNYLENQKGIRDQITINERALLTQQQMERERAAAGAVVDAEKQASELIKKTREKASADQLTALERTMDRAGEIRNARNQTDIASAELDAELLLMTERQKIERINMLELDSLEFRKRELTKFLAQVVGNKEKEVEAQHQIALVDEQITQQKIKNSQRIAYEDKRRQQALEDLKQKYIDFKLTLEDQLDAALRNGRALSAYEQTVRELERAYKDLEPADKQRLLDISAQIDLVEQLNRQHAELKGFFSETFRYVFEGDFDGLFQNLKRRVAEPFIDRISDFLATNLLGFDPNQTDNPVAKPIVGKLEQTNKLLSQIVRATGQQPASGGGGFLGSLMGSLGGLGMGPGGTPMFNFGGLGGQGNSGALGGGLDGINIGSGGFDPRTGTYGNATGVGQGSFLDNLRNLFSTKEGGIFAGRQNILSGKNSRMGGIMGGIGDLAAMAGGMIGGRAGGILSAAGTGMSIGSMFGPWGAAIGAGIGALFGIFSGDPKRKADKRENIPALNKGFVEAIKELNEILSGVRMSTIDPDEAISRANEVRGQIASGFGIQFQSKKYRRQAQTMISGKLVEADRIISDIRTTAERARGATEIAKRILPQFAGGHYFADYFRPNGLVPGMFDGRDNILAMISRGEMVLNPMQQNRVRALAGGDVFANAGIPNYPNASPSPKLATGGIAGVGLSMNDRPPVVVQPNFTLHLEGVTFDERSKAWLESDSGRRALVKVVKAEKKLDSNL